MIEFASMTPRRIDYWSRGVLSVAFVLMAAFASSTHAATPEAKPDVIDAYEQRRGQTLDTIEDHWQLARWCQQSRMPNRARAHAWWIVQRQPDHTDARELLDHVRVGVRWIPREDFEAQRDQALQLSVDLQRHSKTFAQLSQEFLTAYQQDRVPKTAARKLKRFLKVEQLPMLTQWAIHGPDAMTTQILDWVVDCDHSDSTDALARLAVWDHRQGVRQISIDELATRDLQTWIPEMIRWCEGKVSIQHELITSASGDIVGIDRTVSRDLGETQHITRHQTKVVRQELNPAISAASRRWLGKSGEATGDATRMIALAAENDRRELEHSAHATNQLVDVITQRVAVAINGIDPDAVKHQSYSITKLPLEATFDQVRQWWYMARDWQTLPEKEIVPTLITNEYRQAVGNLLPVSFSNPANTSARERLSQSSRVYDIVRMEPQSTGPPTRPSRRPRSFLTRPNFTQSDCLIQGTMIQTDDGLREISTLKVGDQVLSVDLKTNTTAYRSVVTCTRREPVELISITIEGESITCSPGHHFWAVDDGWKSALRLATGDRLYRIGSDSDHSEVVVEGLKAHKPEITYNLKIDGNHNYVVGNVGLLSHDVTFHGKSSSKMQ